MGDDGSYLALYSPLTPLKPMEEKFIRSATLNHIGVVVDDIKATEERVKKAGYTPHSHDDYEPGQRFYFDGPDQIEIEVVQYPKST